MVKEIDTICKIITLLSYQQALFADNARIIVVCWCRQAGKDFTAACKAVTNAMETKSDWYIVSITQRQADATFAKCKKIAEAYKKILLIVGKLAYSTREYEEYEKSIDEKFKCTARTLHLPGGGSVTALPGRDPDTLAGLTGNVIFTEFGLFPRGGYDHWRVIFPLITRGYQIVVISTPRGKNTKFFELVNDPETYSVHTLNIYQMVAAGMELKDNKGKPCTVEEFKKLYGDESGWQREFMIQFTGDLEALVKWAQLQAAGARGIGLEFDCLRVVGDSGWNPGFFDALKNIDGRAELGWDVARHHDLAPLWVNIGRPGTDRHLRHLVIMENCSFALQREIICSAMDTRPTNVGCGDATGLGMDSNEQLATKYAGRWEGVTFTASSKRDLGSMIMTAFDDQSQIIPPTDGEFKFIATDFYAIQKEASGGSGNDGKNLKLTETANPLEPNSHCDIAYAGALALKAQQMIFAAPFFS